MRKQMKSIQSHSWGSALWRSTLAQNPTFTNRLRSHQSNGCSRNLSLRFRKSRGFYAIICPLFRSSCLFVPPRYALGVTGLRGYGLRGLPMCVCVRLSAPLHPRARPIRRICRRCRADRQLRPVGSCVGSAAAPPALAHRRGLLRSLRAPWLRVRSLVACGGVLAAPLALGGESH